MEGIKTFQELDAGCSRMLTEVPRNCLMANAPFMKWMQGSLSVCAFFALAGALEYMDKKKEAMEIAKAGIAFTENRELMTMAQFPYIVRLLERQKTIRQIQRLSATDLVKEEKGIRLVKLVCNDQNQSHAVAIVGKWIFDSNVYMALSLSKESLEWCVNGSKVRMLCGYRITFNKQYNQASKRQRQRQKKKKALAL